MSIAYKLCKPKSQLIRLCVLSSNRLLSTRFSTESVSIRKIRSVKCFSSVIQLLVSPSFAICARRKHQSGSSARFTPRRSYAVLGDGPARELGGPCHSGGLSSPRVAACSWRAHHAAANYYFIISASSRLHSRSATSPPLVCPLEGERGANRMGSGR